jgi:hypothetical protein
MTDRSGYPVRRKRLSDPDDDPTVERMSPGERMEMVWTLTLQAWAFMEGIDPDDEPRLRRDVGRVVRGRR